MKIETQGQQLVELLAIKLYEHDTAVWPPSDNGDPSWMKLCEEDRQIYRDIASGQDDLPMGGQ